MKSGDYLDGMLSDNAGVKANKLRVQKSTSAKLVTVLTGLQVAFAVYTTFLLYYMGPSLDLKAKPDFSWATRIASQWKHLIVQPHVVSRYQQTLKQTTV